MKRKILIITERRADYTKFRPIIKAIEESPKLDYFLVVTGTHLLKEHGKTISEIKNDGFKISSKFNMFSKKKNDTGYEMARSLGKVIIFLSKFIEKHKPDIILSGMDVGANLAVAIVGTHTNIIVAHYEAGDITGTIDEPIRHAISKFAHIHFTTNTFATRRLIRMGEHASLIYTVGNPSLDGIRNAKEIDVKILEKEFGLDFKKPFVIVMQHTVTSEINKTDKHVQETIKAIKELGIQAILIQGNVDAGSQKILKVLKKSNIKLYKSLPFSTFINLLKHSSAIIGNSSTGVMEAPFLHVPSINVGTRQNGRPKAKSVIEVDYDKEEIKTAIKKAINNKEFLKEVKYQKTFFGDGQSAKRIVKILEKININNIPIQKSLSY